mmetsp:Transcript_45241/g.73380  ORF Transcript_45241/g.73380 Transcript_45241/m.73380 type:complete len:206 (+) Transcript_45241:339-956(+)
MELMHCYVRRRSDRAEAGYQTAICKWRYALCCKLGRAPALRHGQVPDVELPGLPVGRMGELGQLFQMRRSEVPIPYHPEDAKPLWQALRTERCQGGWQLLQQLRHASLLLLDIVVAVGVVQKLRRCQHDSESGHGSHPRLWSTLVPGKRGHGLCRDPAQCEHVPSERPLRHMHACEMRFRCLERMAFAHLPGSLRASPSDFPDEQ